MATLRVYVRDAVDKSVICDATVAAYNQDYNRWDAGSTNTMGYYDINLPQNNYQKLEVTMNGYDKYTESGNFIFVDGGQKTVYLNRTTTPGPNKYALMIRIKESNTGNTVSGATVKVEKDSWSSQAQTDYEGRIDFGEQEEGTYYITITKSGYQSITHKDFTHNASTLKEFYIAKELPQVTTHREQFIIWNDINRKVYKAEVTVDAEGYEKVKFTDESGIVNFDDVPNGKQITYTIDHPFHYKYSETLSPVNVNRNNIPTLTRNNFGKNVYILPDDQVKWIIDQIKVENYPYVGTLFDLGQKMEIEIIPFMASFIQLWNDYGTDIAMDTVNSLCILITDKDLWGNERKEWDEKLAAAIGIALLVIPDSWFAKLGKLVSAEKWLKVLKGVGKDKILATGIAKGMLEAKIAERQGGAEFLKLLGKSPEQAAEVLKDVDPHLWKPLREYTKAATGSYKAFDDIVSLALLKGGNNLAMSGKTALVAKIFGKSEWILISMFAIDVIMRVLESMSFGQWAATDNLITTVTMDIREAIKSYRDCTSSYEKTKAQIDSAKAFVDKMKGYVDANRLNPLVQFLQPSFLSAWDAGVNYIEDSYKDLEDAKKIKETSIPKGEHWLYVSSNPGGAKFYLAGEYKLTTKEGEETKLIIKPGTYTYRFEKDGYDTIESTKTFLDAQTSTLSVELHEKGKPYTYGYLEVKTNPDEADFYLGGVFKGKTNLTGDKKIQLASGSYDYKISKSGYKDITGTVYIRENETYTLDKTLESETKPPGEGGKGKISASVSPADAEIWELDTKLGVGHVEVEVDEGYHDITFKKSGYKTETRNVYVKENETEVVNVSLEQEEKPPTPQKAKLNLYTTPDGGKVYIGGEDTGQYTDISFELDQGTYDIIIKKEGYEDIKLTVYLKEGEERTISKEFEVAKPPEKKFRVFIDTEPRGAKIYINDVYTGYETPKTLIMNEGTYIFAFELEGYEREEKEVELK